jgi:hypothetical protein
MMLTGPNLGPTPQTASGIARSERDDYCAEALLTHKVPRPFLSLSLSPFNDARSPGNTSGFNPDRTSRLRLAHPFLDANQSLHKTISTDAG